VVIAREREDSVGTNLVRLEGRQAGVALFPPVGLLVGELAWQAIRLFVSATDSGSGGGGFTIDVYVTTLLFGLPTLVVSLVCCPLLLTWCARRRSGRMNNV